MSEHVTVAGQRLEFRQIGGLDPAAPPVVFLHEGLGSIGLWRDFPERFAAATGCPVLLYSRRGHGRSEPLAPPYRRPNDYLHREALEMLPALLDHFAIENPILFGHSDGATIALIHAAAAGRPVRAAIIEAPHVFIEQLSLTSIRATVDSWHNTDLRRRMARYHDHAEGTFRGWAEMWLHADYDLNIEGMLPGVRCPLLVIQGEDDRYGTIEQVTRVVRQVSGPAESLLIPRCGHSPHQEAPTVVLDAALTFLDRHLVVETAGVAD